MENILYIPKGRRNLFFVTSAPDKGLSSKSSSISCDFLRGNTVKACGVRHGRLFRMLINVAKTKCQFSNKSEINLASKYSLQVWHEIIARCTAKSRKKLILRMTMHYVELASEESNRGASLLRVLNEVRRLAQLPTLIFATRWKVWLLAMLYTLCVSYVIIAVSSLFHFRKRIRKRLKDIWHDAFD